MAGLTDYLDAPQISDISHLLPPTRRTALHSTGDVLESLIVRVNSDSAFGHVARNWEGGPGVVRHNCISFQGIADYTLSRNASI